MPRFSGKLVEPSDTAEAPGPRFSGTLIEEPVEAPVKRGLLERAVGAAGDLSKAAVLAFKRPDETPQEPTAAEMADAQSPARMIMSPSGARNLVTQSDPEAPTINLPGSVMHGVDERTLSEGRSTLEATGGAPVNQQTLGLIQSAMNRATPQERAAMAARPDFVGQVAGVAAQDIGTDLSRTLPVGDSVEARAQLARAQGAAPEVSANIADVGAATGLPEAPLAQAKPISADEAYWTGADPLSRATNTAVLAARQTLAGAAHLSQDILGWDQAFGEGIPQGIAAEDARIKRAQDDLGKSPAFLQRSIEGAISSTITQLPGLVAGLATGGAAAPLIYIGVQQGLQQYGQDRAAGKPVADSMFRAAMWGALESGGELLAIPYELNALRTAFNGVPTGKLGSWAAEFFAGLALREIPGEMATQTGEFAFDKWGPSADHPEWGWGDFVDQMKDVVMQTAIQTGMMAGGGAAATAAFRARPDAKARDLAAAINADVAARSAPLTEAERQAVQGVIQRVVVQPRAMTRAQENAQLRPAVAAPSGYTAAQADADLSRIMSAPDATSATAAFTEATTGIINSAIAPQTAIARAMQEARDLAAARDQAELADLIHQEAGDVMLRRWPLTSPLPGPQQAEQDAEVQRAAEMARLRRDALAQQADEATRQSIQQEAKNAETVRGNQESAGQGGEGGLAGIQPSAVPGSVLFDQGNQTAPAKGVTETDLGKQAPDNIGTAPVIGSDVLAGKPGMEKIGQLSDVKVDSAMVGSVVSQLHNDEIFRRVVESVPIDVMNSLVGRKWSANDFLGNRSVLLNSLSVDANKPVPPVIVRVVNAMLPYLESGNAGGRAKGVFSSDLPQLSGEGNPTIGAIVGRTGTASRAAGNTAKNDTTGRNAGGLSANAGPALGTIQGKHGVTPRSSVVTGTGVASTTPAPPSISQATPEHFTAAIRAAQPQADRGALAYVQDVRAKMAEQFPTKEAFDAAVHALLLEHPERFQAQTHAWPGRLTDADKAELVPNGRGGWFNTLGLRSEQKAPAAQPERRANTARRQAVAAMSPDELRRALLTDELTGLGNRRAYDEAQKGSHQVALDLDSLKFFNDAFGHEAGDRLIKAFGTILRWSTRRTPATGYHLAGDEFAINAHSAAEAQAVVDDLRRRLEQTELIFTLPDGSETVKKGIDFSHGIATTYQAADAALLAHKAERQAAGQRAPRGEAPPGITTRPAPGLQAGADQVAAEVGPEGAPQFAPQPGDVPGVPRHAVGDLPIVEVKVADLKLSKDVPQFKKEANAQGVVQPLGGKFDRTGVAPIQVWERLNGDLEVISGRHRLDLAKRSGEVTMPVQIHREADGFTQKQASTLDAVLNIRDEQGSIADYANYFREAGITEAAAVDAGLLARAKGRSGFAIARDASAEVYAAHSAGLISDEAAEAIARAAPGSSTLQAVGLKLVNEGKAISLAENTMRAVGMMEREGEVKADQGDIFGFDDSAIREAEAMAKRASAAQRAIREQISAVSGATKRPELARKLGVDVKNPKAVLAKIDELKAERIRLDNWPLYPDLVREFRGEVPVGVEQRRVRYNPNQADAFAEPAAQAIPAAPAPESPIAPTESGLTPTTPTGLRADAEAIKAAADQKAKAEAAADKLRAGKTVKADQIDLFNTQGGLFQSVPGYTVGHEVREETGRTEAGGAQGAQGELDLFAATPVPGSTVQSLEKIVVEAQQVGKRRVAFTRIKSAGQAASVFQDLNKSPREKMQVLGLDKNDKPIAFFDLFAGTITQASVYPREVWTAIYQTPGVKSVWIAHQHPSGVAEPSQADRLLTRTLQAALTPDIGVTLRGHLIVTTDATVDIGPSGDVRTPVEVAQGVPRFTLPIIERQIVKQDTSDRQSMSAPNAVKDFFRNFNPKETGLLVMDAQNRATGWWPMSIAEMSKLRTGDVNTGMAALMRAVGKGNAAAAIAYSPTPTRAMVGRANTFTAAVQNVGTALKLADVNMLDAIVKKDDGTFESYAELGQPTDRSGGTFFARSEQQAQGPTQSGITEQTLRSEISRAFGPRAESLVGDLLIPIARQEDIAAMLPEVAKKMKSGDRVLGFYYNGKSYIVMENVSADGVRSVVLHELGVHAGLESMLGPERYAQLLRQVDIMHRAGNKAVIEARTVAEREANKASDVPQETIAYLVHNHPELPFVRRIIAEIKAFLFRKFGILGDRLTVDDIAALASASVLHATATAKDAAPMFMPSEGGGPQEIQSPMGQIIAEQFARGPLYSPAADSLAQYWRSRTWANEAEARDMLKRRIAEDNERYPMFKKTDPAIVDELRFTRAKGGQVKLVAKRDARMQPNWSEGRPEGDTPNVDWTARDNQDKGTPESIKKEFGRARGNLYQAWIPIRELPTPRGEDIHDGALDEHSGMREELAHRGRTDPPPLKVRIGPRGKVELLDGNHRLAYWNEQGYSDVPAWVLDERPAHQQPDNVMFSRSSVDPARQGAREIAKFSLAPAIASTQTTGDERDSMAAIGMRFVRDSLVTGKQFNWLHKTVGTQQHKALINPEFRPVFHESQAFITDTSKYANESADLAPDMLPRVEKFKDLWKKAAKPEDVKAISQAMYAGTLYGGGNPLEGRVWTDAELRSGRAQDGPISLPMFDPLNDTQIGLYRQTLASVNKSLLEQGKSLIHRVARQFGIGFDRGMDLADVAETVRGKLDDAIESERERIYALQGQIDDVETEFGDEDVQHAHDRIGKAIKASEDQIATFEAARSNIADIETKINSLIRHGYFPAMRFGQYAVHVIGQDGKQKYFSLFETALERNQAARTLAEEFPGASIDKFILSKEQYRLFQSLNLDTLELFIDFATDAEGKPLKNDPVVQQFIQAASSDRSMLKRHLHRKGLPGYSEDVPRVLANFTVTNARNVSGNYHGAEMLKLAQDIKAGDVKDEAIKLVRYLVDPQEEASKVRGLLFTQFLGGSIAFGLVNMTQPALITAPYLVQYTTYADAVKRLGSAAVQKIESLTGDIKDAYQRAVHEGVVAPQEIHQLRAETGGGIAGRSLAWRKFSFAWGAIYSITEQFNRKTTFLAAYNVAKAKGEADPYTFAKEAVEQTQFLYNKGSRPNWARGPIGGVVMTFKQFSISYIELASRLWKLPDKRPFAAMALTLLAGAGAEGFPFAEDFEDILDTIMQWAGFNWNTKKKLREGAEALLGEDLGQFALHGMSGLPIAPIDLSNRLGFQNIIPGTAALKPSETGSGKARDVLEVAGPVGQWFPTQDTMMGRAMDRLWNGDMWGVLKSGIASRAVGDIAKGVEMAQTGEYRDLTGKKVMDTSLGEAGFKLIGLQPARVAKESRNIGEVMQDIGLQKATEADIVSQWAKGVVRDSPADIDDARAQLQRWNETNPESRIRILPSQIRERVKALQMSRTERMIKSAPPEIRGNVRERLQ